MYNITKLLYTYGQAGPEQISPAVYEATVHYQFTLDRSPRTCRPLRIPTTKPRDQNSKPDGVQVPRNFQLVKPFQQLLDFSQLVI